MSLIVIVGMAIPSACFLFGYCLGMSYERKAWDIWLKARRS